MPVVPAPDFEDRLLTLLPDPDEIGTSEYRLLYDHIHETVAGHDGGEPLPWLLTSSLDEIDGEVARFRRLIEEALQA
jgi:hypothetical protein